MRYYDLVVQNTDGSTYKPGGVDAHWTTLNGNTPNMNAQLLELDVPSFSLGTPIGAAAVKLWGVPLQLIEQASDFNGKKLILQAGMQKGLPLANPAQRGTVLQGIIYQSYGNWVNTDQWVQFVVVSDGTTPDKQPNLTFNCVAGQSMSAAIQATLAPIFKAPLWQVNININPKLVFQEAEQNVSYTMTQFAQYVNQVSKDLIGGTYGGVQVVVRQNIIDIFDGTVVPPVKMIDFVDLIGQPTWIDPGTVQAITVMRADFNVGDSFKFPPKVFGTIAPSDSYVASQLKDRSVFQGTFTVQSIRHVGNSRQADAASWVTVFNLTPQAS